VLLLHVLRYNNGMLVEVIMKLDGKFHGVVIKNKNQQIVPQDQWVVFLAKDNAFPATLEFYQKECERLGASLEQIQAVQNMRDRVAAWRAANPQLLKVPDVEVGEIQ
jgi:ABC-type thiamine transport system substrate-binding protein